MEDSRRATLKIQTAIPRTVDPPVTKSSVSLVPQLRLSASLAVGLACCVISMSPVARAQSALAERFSPVGIRQVKVDGPMGRRIEMTVKNNLLAIDVERDFLQPFRDRNQRGGYIGLGKLIDSLVRFASYTGDEQVLALKRHVVSEVIKTQASDGYIGLCVPEARMRKLWDAHEMAYLVLGLSADHRFFGREESLEAARELADYIILRWSEEPENKPGEGVLSDHVAVTGIGSSMLALYTQTGDARYLDFCVNTLNIASWDYPIVVGRWGRIGGHAYAYLSRCLAQLRIHRLKPDQRLLSQSRKIFDFLTKQDGMVITGTCGDHECWHDTQTGTHNLGETCATAYLIRWLDSLLRLEGDSRYGDIMERAVYNALFAAQSLDGRHIRYYSPFDGPREYFDRDTYRCPGNYRRSLAELPGLIYYSAAAGKTPSDQSRGVMINLYTASSATVNSTTAYYSSCDRRPIIPTRERWWSMYRRHDQARSHFICGSRVGVLKQ